MGFSSSAVALAQSPSFSEPQQPEWLNEEDSYRPLEGLNVIQRVKR